jgi:hypothetical protein
MTFGTQYEDLYLVTGKKCNTDSDKGTDDCVYLDDVGLQGTLYFSSLVLIRV